MFSVEDVKQIYKVKIESLINHVVEDYVKPLLDLASKSVNLTWVLSTLRDEGIITINSFNDLKSIIEKLIDDEIEINKIIAVNERELVYYGKLRRRGKSIAIDFDNQKKLFLVMINVTLDEFLKIVYES